MYKNDKGVWSASGVLQVENRFECANSDFPRQEERELHICNPKPRKILYDQPTSLKRSILSTRGTTILMTQADKIDQRSIPSEQELFTIHRDLAQYIGVDTCADICANIRLVEPGSGATTKQTYQYQERTITHLRQTRTH